MHDRESPHRFLTFVDAIVAIAITLLVLPLAELAPEVGDAPVADLLREHRSDLGAFFLSFVVIASLWLTQHRAVAPLVKISPAITRLLLLWALTIVVLPFLTVLVAEAGDEALTKVLYIGTLALSALCLAAVEAVIAREPGLRDDGPTPDPWQAVGAAAMLLAALGLSVAIPALSYWPLLLLVLADPLVGAVRGRRG